MRDRFEFSARLGSGGFGDVYRAHDGLRGEDVAVKILRHIGPLHLRMLKREFRSLADVVHPNLVSLHELISDGAHWCITMEFVDGVDLLTEVHGARDTEDDAALWTPTVEDPSARSVTDVRRRAVPAPLLLDVDKVRSVFRQIAEAIAALHAAGKLHRDIKPSNILVTSSGRAVVLDFGLVMELTSGAADDNDGLGTVAYMSPEQAQYLPLDAASDWYSFGVTLFEALTGGLPFDGTPSVVLSKKSTLDAPDPAALSPDVPRDLTELCARLLARDPAARPDGAAVL
ncbi:MAG: serine/threonine-protein kinase, partial [Deltaproteobacteria bacterium]|nr:serine/threonine-protein kinase [Deltaproteobacteria bacterium]